MTDFPEPDFGLLARGMRRMAERAEKECERPAPKRGVADKCRASDVWTVELNPPDEHTEEIT